MTIQRVDGTTLYDAFELSFNPTDKTSILNLNNVDIMSSINSKAVYNTAYNKADLDLKCPSLIGAAPSVLTTSVELATSLGNDSKCATPIQNQLSNKANKLNTYSKLEINDKLLLKCDHSTTYLKLR